MSTYHTCHSSFRIPGRWRDRSVNILRGPDVSLVITRTPLLGAEAELADYADATLAAQLQGLPSHQVVRAGCCDAGGRTAYAIAYKWRSAGDWRYRQHVFVPCARHVLQLSIASSLATANRSDAQLHAMLASARFREPLPMQRPRKRQDNEAPITVGRPT